jgi:hypothetical protein
MDKGLTVTVAPPALRRRDPCPQAKVVADTVERAEGLDGEPLKD